MVPHFPSLGHYQLAETGVVPILGRVPTSDTNLSISVDPDVLGNTANRSDLVGFVTHSRTTGFEKKFRRMVEEILEHHTHRTGGVGISFVAEPSR